MIAIHKINHELPNQQCWKRRSQSCGINPAQAVQFWDLEAAVSELGSAASSPSSACIAFFFGCLPRFARKPALILAGEISSTFVPWDFAVLYKVSRSGTESHSLPIERSR